MLAVVVGAIVVVVPAGWATVVSGRIACPGYAGCRDDAEDENDEEDSGVHLVKVAAS